MILKELVNYIKNVSLAYPTVQEFGEGDIYEFMNSGEHKYPTIFLTIESITSDEDTQTLNATLFYVDRLLSNSSNKIDVQTVGLTALKSIKEKLEEANYINFTSINYTPFTEKFSDLCAGAFAQCNIQVNDTLECDDFELGTLTIKEDGLYNVLGYSQVIVDVTKVRSINGHSGDITLGEGLTINDNNVLSTTVKAEWGSITGSITNQTDLVEYVKQQAPNIVEGENIYFTPGEGNSIVVNADDMRYDDSIGAFKSKEKLNKYLYSIEFNTIDYTAALEHFKTISGENIGGCSMLRKGDLYGRNYDWTINKQVEFILKTKASGRLYSVTGIATAAAFTTDLMDSNTYTDEYKYLPFRLVDGINEKGLVCNVNQLPKNVDSTKNIDINGNTPLVNKRESISMIMLVRYILDRFEHAVEAAQYIQNYVNVYPIIGEDSEPMNFHFAIADKNQTVYLYFYEDRCEYEVKQAGEDLVMTNFRLAGTELVDGHYSITGSNIESFGQGIERANVLLDYTDGDLLGVLFNDINFTKAYTTNTRLTDFAGIDDTVISDTEGLEAIQADAALLYQQETEAGTLRTDADLWQTVHSIVYNLNDKTIRLKIQEIEGSDEVFTFNPYPPIEIEFTPDTIVPTTTNFVEGTTYSIYNALQRITNLFAGYWNYIKTNITDLIPSTASSTNQLADKSFVNETVAQNAANFRGNWGTWLEVPTDSTLYPEDYAGNRTPTNNDYMVVTDASGYDADYDGSWRFLYTGDWDELGKSGWKPAYRIGSAFTDAQQAAIDSTITKEKVDNYDGYEGRITSVETDKRDRIYTANKLYATDAEGKDIALDITTVQAHNYGDLTNKPTINGVEVSGDKTSNDYYIYTKEVAKTGTNIALKANELTTVIATEDVTVSLDTSADLADGVNEYRLQLAANAPITITFNIVGLKWSYDVPNYLVSGKVYEISIINKHATYLVF